MTTKRKIHNPLALAVLACLTEHPMHPYEMATTLRERGKDQSIKLNYGALYTVVEALQQHGLIVAQETEREGRRPERTVYHLTETGRLELIDWISELISRPVKEYTQFEAGLSLIPVLPPEDAAALLTQRCARLEMEIVQKRSLLRLDAERGVARLHLIESGDGGGHRRVGCLPSYHSRAEAQRTWGAYGTRARLTDLGSTSTWPSHGSSA